MRLTLTAEDLRPVIREVGAEMLDHFGDAKRAAFPEAEAAPLVGARGHALRDARLRGKIRGAKIGWGIKYTRSDLFEFVEGRRAAGTEADA